MGHRGNRRIRRVAAVLGAIGCATAVAAAPAGAYKLSSLQITSKSFLQCPDCLAVDRAGDMFVLKTDPVSSLPQLHDSVVEFAPSGEKLREFSTTIRQGARWVAGYGLAVSGDGRSVAVVGTVQAARVGAPYDPFVGRYETKTGKLIVGRSFDPNNDSTALAVTLDADGKRLFVTDSGNVTSPPTTASVWEFTVRGLRVHKHFTLTGRDDNPNSIAVFGDSTFAVQIDPENIAGAAYSGPSSVQYLSSAGLLERTTPIAGGGLAIGAEDRLLAGADDALELYRRPNATPEETFGTGDFHGRAFIGGVDAADEVFALDGGERSTSILRFTASRPRTTITSHPSTTVSRQRVTFGVSTGAGDRIECRLVRAVNIKKPSYTPCVGSASYRGLHDGFYTFQARAISKEGPVDRTPAEFGFSVSLHYPQAVITSHPAATDRTASARFGFKAAPKGAKFLCRLVTIEHPTGPYRSCTSPTTYSGLANGTYLFTVEAVAHGLTQLAPAVYFFTVRAHGHSPKPPKISAPSVVPLSPAGQVDTKGRFAMVVTWTASDPVTSAPHLAYTLFRRTGKTKTSLGPWLQITSYDGHDGRLFALVPVKPTGVTEFQVQATDPAGAVGTSPASPAIRPKLTDDFNPSISFSGFGSGIETPTAVGGSVAQSDSDTGTATLRFTGHSILVVGATGPNLGTLRVCIDPGTSTAQCTNHDEYSPDAVQRATVAVVDGLSAGRHTIQVGPINQTPVVVDEFTALR
jgi:hypothetical protein